jgi:iron(III) transport system substrate-binding protein
MSRRLTPITIVMVLSVVLAACGGGAGNGTVAGSSAPAASAAPSASSAANAWSLVLAAAEKEKSLLFYAPDQKLADLLSAGFKKAYPWAEVQSYVAGGANIAARAITEAKAGSPTADVLIATGAYQKSLVEVGAIAAAQVPNDSTLPKEFQDTSFLQHILYVSPIVIQYNTGKVRPEEIPSTVVGLSDARWKGVIAIDPPANNGTSGLLFACQKAVLGAERWMQWLTEMKANVRLQANTGDAYTAALTGEADLALGGPLQIVNQRAGAPMAFKAYKDVVFINNTTWLAGKAAHPNVGKVFINWLLTEDAMQIGASTGRTPALPIQSPVSLANLLPAGTTYAPLSCADDFYANVQAYDDVYLKLWPKQ